MDKKEKIKDTALRKIWRRHSGKDFTTLKVASEIIDIALEESKKRIEKIVDKLENKYDEEFDEDYSNFRALINDIRFKLREAMK